MKVSNIVLEDDFETKIIQNIKKNKKRLEYILNSFEECSDEEMVEVAYMILSKDSYIDKYMKKLIREKSNEDALFIKKALESLNNL